MTSDIGQFLSYEIKKELAERYFGFRKLIEDDKADLEKDILHHQRTVGQKIVWDLNRIYIMLGDEKLIRQFLALTGLEEQLYYDPYILTSATLRARIFAGVKTRGLTAAGRFKHLFMQTYEQLTQDVAVYREKYAELVDNQQTIEEEIKIFYRKNDISTIMGFLRMMDKDSSHSVMEGVPENGFADSLEKRMQVGPPMQVRAVLPQISPLIPLAQIKKELKKLAEEAFRHHPDGFTLPG
ncbi:MAG: hypothetical protein ACOY4H_13535 [Thermodesulfobacteriota bacterium]